MGSDSRRGDVEPYSPRQLKTLTQRPKRLTQNDTFFLEEPMLSK